MKNVENVLKSHSCLDSNTLLRFATRIKQNGALDLNVISEKGIKMKRAFEDFLYGVSGLSDINYSYGEVSTKKPIHGYHVVLYEVADLSTFKVDFYKEGELTSSATSSHSNFCFVLYALLIQCLLDKCLRDSRSLLLCSVLSVLDRVGNVAVEDQPIEKIDDDQEMQEEEEKKKKALEAIDEMIAKARKTGKPVQLVESSNIRRRDYADFEEDVSDYVGHRIKVAQQENNRLRSQNAQKEKMAMKSLNSRNPFEVESVHDDSWRADSADRENESSHSEGEAREDEKDADEDVSVVSGGPGLQVRSPDSYGLIETPAYGNSEGNNGWNQGRGSGSLFLRNPIPMVSGLKPRAQRAAEPTLWPIWQKKPIDGMNWSQGKSMVTEDPDPGEDAVYPNFLGYGSRSNGKDPGKRTGIGASFFNNDEDY